MSQTEPSGLSPVQYVERHERELVAIGHRFSYYSGGLTLSEAELQEYLQEPIAALPPRVLTELPDVELFLVPYLERLAGRDSASSHRVRTEKPNERRTEAGARWQADGKAVLMLAVHHAGVAEYHYRLYQLLASLLVERWTDEVRERYEGLLREELNQRVYGEVDQPSWRLKQALTRRQRKFTGTSKAFTAYARQSFEDSMTLYLHGICCDIDVEAGPQQLPSRTLRKRLDALKEMYPPPGDYAVFPEDLKPNSPLPANKSLI